MKKSVAIEMPSRGSKIVNKLTHAVLLALITFSLSSVAQALPLSNGDFSDGLSGWITEGWVSADSGYAVLSDGESAENPSSRMYQVSSVESGYYVLSFDFKPSVGTEVELGTFYDTFFSSLYFGSDSGIDLNLMTYAQGTGLVDADASGITVHQGEVSESSLGEGWYHYTLSFTTTLSYVAPVFELFDLNLQDQDSSVAVDNVLISAYDFCPNDPDKTLPGACGCGVADTDADANGVPDCLESCVGTCNLENPDYDEDGDGVSNCDELVDSTDACDSGSYVAKLEAQACAGANGFLGQTNIATVVNHEDTALSVTVSYRNALGVKQESVSFELGSHLKRDVIVNDIGLKANSYGTVCVSSDAQVDGAWSGGVTLYKPNTKDSSKQDFALYYPFVNPKQGKSSAPVNTNTLDTANPNGAVANWVRLTDGVEGDSQGLTGTLFYYNIDGVLIDFDVVDLPDGGRFDFGAHAKLGARQVGLVEFLPTDSSQYYFFEVSRYYYEGEGAKSENFVTAFPLPSRPSTGEAISAEVGRAANETHVVEMINDNGATVPVDLTVYDAQGAALYSETNDVPSKSSIHRIIGEGVMASGAVGVAEVSVPKISVSAITVAYAFGKDGELLYAYAPPFLQSHGKVQYSEFNSFLNHRNRLSLINTNSDAVESAVVILDWQGNKLDEFTVEVPAKGIVVKELELAADTYGTIVVTSGSTGIVVRNDVVKDGQYDVVYVGR